MIKITLCFVLIFEIGCGKLKDDELSIQRRNYIGNELRTDGYFYYYNQQHYVERIVVYLLYRNGIIRTCGSPVSFQDFENKIDVYSNGSSTKNEWGVFVVENDNIKYEKWYGARFLESYITYIYAGKILNDTTFHITESYYSGTKETKQINEVWHFKQSANKPDSTNVYIK